MKIDGALTFAGPGHAGEAAARLEEQGFDGALSFEGPHEPFMPLALAAHETSRIQLMTAVAIAFARNPMVCAYAANDLQLISDGRFILGLGSQIRPHIERRFSQTWSKPNARMREFVLAMRAIFRTWNEGEPLRFEGEFYRHTLMTPFLSPQPNPHGPPPIYLAGFGAGMIRIAGEVADGWMVHPLHTTGYMEEVALPALQEGLAKGGRTAADCEISAQTICMVGETEEQIEKAKAAARMQISFYGSTPAYRVALDHEGWGDLQPELNRMSKAGLWGEMTALISDEMLEKIGVIGTPEEVGRRLRERNSFAARTSVILYDESGDPDALPKIAAGVHGEN